MNYAFDKGLRSRIQQRNMEEKEKSSVVKNKLNKRDGKNRAVNQNRHFPKEVSEKAIGICNKMFTINTNIKMEIKIILSYQISPVRDFVRKKKIV